MIPLHFFFLFFVLWDFGVDEDSIGSRISWVKVSDFIFICVVLAIRTFNDYLYYANLFNLLHLGGDLLL